MVSTTTEMISALEKKIGKEDLRKRINEIRLNPDTGYIHTSQIKAIFRIFYEEFPTGIVPEEK